MMRASQQVLCAVALAAALAAVGAGAMTLNLAGRWDDGCSGPQTPFLCFYSPQRDTQGDGAARRPGTRLVG